MKYYKNVNNELFENPIIDNHLGLIEITKAQFDAQLIANNTPTQAEADALRIKEIDAELNQIDLDSIRSLRKHGRGNQDSFDTARLAELDDRADALRAERTLILAG